VSRSTSQPKVSSSWWRRPKNRLAGLRSGSLNSTSKSTSLVPLAASRAVEPTTSSRLTSNLRHAGNEAFLMSSVFMFRLLRSRSTSSSQIERTAPRGSYRLLGPVDHFTDQVHHRLIFEHTFASGCCRRPNDGVTRLESRSDMIPQSACMHSLAFHIDLKANQTVGVSLSQLLG